MFFIADGYAYVSSSKNAFLIIDQLLMCRLHERVLPFFITGGEQVFSKCVVFLWNHLTYFAL